LRGRSFLGRFDMAALVTCIYISIVLRALFSLFNR
jgi:hypothetical protein